MVMEFKIGQTLDAQYLRLPIAWKVGLNDLRLRWISGINMEVFS